MIPTWDQHNRPWYPFPALLQSRYGQPVAKIALDAGFTCPNRDGTIGWGGCLFCNNEGFSPNTRGTRRSIREQLRAGFQFYQQQRGINRFIAYYQAYTNTHADLSRLDESYRQSFDFRQVVGLAIGTRPDCAPEPILQLLDGYARDRDVYIEYGLQSSHDQTLQRMARGHSWDDFTDAMQRTQPRRLHICIHVILGLPGEGRQEVITTAKRLAQFRFESVKVHVLHIMRGTGLEAAWQAGQFRLLELDEYAELVCDFLEHTPACIAVQRLTGDAPANILLGPDWCNRKNLIQARIIREFERRGTRQGSRCEKVAP